MNDCEQMAAAEREYDAKFGEWPDIQWYDGDIAAYTKLLLDAIAKGLPLPDWETANEIPADALT